MNVKYEPTIRKKAKDAGGILFTVAVGDFIYQDFCGQEKALELIGALSLLKADIANEHAKREKAAIVETVIETKVATE
jgi:hypothetical protein